jgi:hypothetical protein
MLATVILFTTAHAQTNPFTKAQVGTASEKWKTEWTSFATISKMANMDQRCDARAARGRNKVWARMKRPALMIAFCCLVHTACFAQTNESNPPPDAPSTSVQSQTTPQAANPLQGGMQFVQLLERKSLVFPDLATNKEVFGRRDKFMLAINNSVSLATIGATLVAAAYGQAIDSPEGYGQGAEGYGKRLGSGMARAASENLFGTFAIASILREDPRFYVKRNLSFGQSVKYAAVRVAVTRSDAGRRVVNFSGLLGPLAGEALANTYFPEGSRGVSSTVIRYSADLGWRFAGNLLRQYWPNINKKLRLAPPVLQSAPAPNKP